VDLTLASQYLLAGLVIGVIYSLMALGISFIYSVMKMINWGMGEFFMIGSYVQYALIVTVVGKDRWWLALPVAMASVFLLGLVVQRVLLRPMYVGAIERRDEYATIVTIALMIFFRNLAIVLGGRTSTRRPTTRGRSRSARCRISGNRFVALVGTRSCSASSPRDQDDVDRPRAAGRRAEPGRASRRPAWTCCAWT
jgi:branched-subunit amino acid ABC-type transport system permease component